MIAPNSTSTLPTELRDAAREMTGCALIAATKPPAEGDGFPSQDAKNYAQAALAFTQAYCTLGKAGAGR
jgi:hypothetical protein